MNLKNKKIFIFGGFGLIGSKIVKLLIDHKCKVIILDIKKKRINNANNKFVFFDVSDLENIELNFNKLIKKFGCPDIVINCSYPSTADWNTNNFEMVSLRSMRENIDMHMNSYAWISKMSAEIMKRSRKQGSIVMLNSIYGIQGQDLSIYKNTKLRENISYSLIKGGLANFTKQISSFYGKSGIRVNSVIAGGIIGHIKGSANKQDKTFIKNYSSKVPLGRLANPEDIAKPVIFLISDYANYITGTNLIVDGGWSAI
jgi:NAD(P)-dependent dehydrogenase (short-subunit alcohol dehydrogenase family)